MIVFRSAVVTVFAASLIALLWIGGERIARLIAIALFVAVLASWVLAGIHLLLNPAPVHPHQPGDARYDVFAR